MNNHIVELARQFKEVRDEHAAQETFLKALTKKWDELEAALLEAMIDEGVNSVDVDGVGKLSMRTENYLSVNAANTDQFYSYLKLSGNGALLKEYVNPRTLSAWLKAHLAEVSQQFKLNGPVDDIEARDMALEFLNKQGASYFTKRGISVRK